MSEVFGGRRMRADAEYPHMPVPTVDPIDAAMFDDLPVLRGLLQISQAVLHANYFDEVLEVIAEQACTTLNAASLSISRWEREPDNLRTLINVGDLGPGEERWPQDELYLIGDDRHVSLLLQHGRPYIMSVDDPDAHPAGVALLRRLGKTHEIAVPIMHGDVMWGELWATDVGQRRFGPDDVQLLQAIAALTAVAIGRTELFGTVWRHAHQDPLTGAANRRAMESYFDEIDWDAAAPVVMICDIDDFKGINDTDGHTAGDAALCAVAMALQEVAHAVDGAMVARLGGDEFCVLLPRSTIVDAERLTVEAADRIRTATGLDLTLGWGAAAWSGSGSWRDLATAADAALLAAKDCGTGRFSAVPARRRRGGWAGLGRRSIDHLVPRVVALLDEHRPEGVRAALEILAAELGTTVDASEFSVATVPSGTETLTHTNEPVITSTADGRAVLELVVDDGADHHLVRVCTVGGPTRLAAVLPHARVLANYCLRST